MKSHIANKAHIKWLLAILITFLSTAAAIAQVPDAPNPPRLVNDFAGILSAEQRKTLEDSLAYFARKTSNQIAIVTMNDLGGMDPAQMATEIGEKWGVGGKDDRNGVVILIKPKNATKGQAFIATGYGLEGALPDAICRRIVDSRMIPEFKRNDYYAGIEAALKVIKPIAAGEYSKEQFEDDEDTDMIIGFIIFAVLFVIIYIFISRGNKGDGNSGTMGSGGFFGGPIIFGGGSGSHSSGGGSGFGGFGGFGGGSFGGGGAGGSW